MPTILFVDNNFRFLKARTSLLENEGYKVLTAGNPNDARRILNEQHVDLVILDIRLVEERNTSDFSGVKLAKEAPSVPKIILTGFYNQSAPQLLRLVTQSELPSVSAVLKKTDDFSSLLNAVRTTLDRNIFIVHGHDEEAKNLVKGYITEIGLRPIILHEQPDSGRAIIQKFEDYSNVGFAIALLTADDVGGSADERGAKRKVIEKRARQNVIFELGYFLGKLGPRRVKALYKRGVHIPSDYLGVLYIQLDSGDNWKKDLVREIRGAGITVPPVNSYKNGFGVGFGVVPEY